MHPRVTCDIGHFANIIICILQIAYCEFVIRMKYRRNPTRPFNYLNYFFLYCISFFYMLSFTIYISYQLKLWLRTTILFYVYFLTLTLLVILKFVVGI